MIPLFFEMIKIKLSSVGKGNSLLVSPTRAQEIQITPMLTADILGWPLEAKSSAWNASTNVSLMMIAAATGTFGAASGKGGVKRLS